MSKLFGKAMEAIGMEVVEDDDLEHDEMEDSMYGDVKVVEPKSSKRKSQPDTPERKKGADPYDNPSQAFFQDGSRKKIAMMKMFIVEPENFDQVREIADLLREKKGVIVNLEEVEYEDARKIIDFLSGNIYALGGTVHKISSGIILFAPDTLEVDNMKKKRDKPTESFEKRPKEEDGDTAGFALDR